MQNTDQTSEFIYVPIVTSGDRYPEDINVYDGYATEICAFKGLISILIDRSLLLFENYCDYKTDSKYKINLDKFTTDIFDKIYLGCECTTECECWVQQLCDYIKTDTDFENICYAFGNGYKNYWTYKIHKILLHK